MSTCSLKGHLEWKFSLVFYCCPSAELTAMDGVVTAMCGALGFSYFSVSCANWDPQVQASSCATAEDIFPGFSVCFHWNHAWLHGTHLEFSCHLCLVSPIFNGKKLCLLCSVSEDELMREADDMGVAVEKYAEDLLHALTGGGGQGGQRRHNDEEAVYSFQLTPDHCRLSYQKISGNVSVSKRMCRSVHCTHLHLKYCLLKTVDTLDYTTCEWYIQDVKMNNCPPCAILLQSLTNLFIK